MRMQCPACRKTLEVENARSGFVVSCPICRASSSLKEAPEALEEPPRVEARPPTTPPPLPPRATERPMWKDGRLTRRGLVVWLGICLLLAVLLPTISYIHKVVTESYYSTRNTTSEPYQSQQEKIRREILYRYIATERAKMDAHPRFAREEDVAEALLRTRIELGHLSLERVEALARMGYGFRE